LEIRKPTNIEQNLGWSGEQSFHKAMVGGQMPGPVNDGITVGLEEKTRSKREMMFMSWRAASDAGWSQLWSVEAVVDGGRLAS